VCPRQLPSPPDLPSIRPTNPIARPANLGRGGWPAKPPSTTSCRRPNGSRHRGQSTDQQRAPQLGKKMTDDCAPLYPRPCLSNTHTKHTPRPPISYQPNIAPKEIQGSRRVSILTVDRGTDTDDNIERINKDMYTLNTNEASKTSSSIFKTIATLARGGQKCLLNQEINKKMGVENTVSARLVPACLALHSLACWAWTSADIPAHEAE